MAMAMPMPPSAIAGLRLFFSLLVVTLATSPRSSKSLFLSTRGRSHRLAGAANLAWLLAGAVWLVRPNPNDRGDDDGWAAKCLAYDATLGVLGVVATLTAARDFPHRRVANRIGESGTLSREAVVTQGEMVEHAFYQGLNLWQALYLHAITWAGVGSEMRTTKVGRMALLFLVTLPWAWREWFPVNSFSANWANKQEAVRGDVSEGQRHQMKMGTEMGGEGLNSVNRMYQVKKWQYVFYKHVILHGLNISVAFPKGALSSSHGDSHDLVPLTHQWRVFWLALNTSYVMEFFLQSIVKRGVLSQHRMMILNGLLMGSSSVAAVEAVFGRVRIEAALISLFFNFTNRHHDVFNTMLAGFIVANI